MSTKAQTQHKAELQQLRASEKRWRLLVEYSNDAIAMVAKDGRILYENPAVNAMLGYAPEELIGQTAFDLLHADDRETAAHYFDEILAHPGQRIVTRARFTRKDGTWCWVEATNINCLDDPDIGAVLTYYRDITQHKEAEEALRKNENQLQALVTSLDDIVFEVDEGGTYLNVWTANEDMLFQPRGDIVGRRFDEVFGEEASRPFFEFLRCCLESGIPQSLEYPVDLPGGMRWFNARFNPIHSANQTRKTVSIMVRDITERKRAEDALKESETTFHDLFDNLPMQSSIYKLIRDEHGEIIDWEVSKINPLGAASLGVDANAVIGQRTSSLYGEAVMKPYLETCRQIVTSGKPRIFETHFETNGRDYLSSAFLVGNEYYATISMDITEHKQAERQLRESQSRSLAMLNAIPDLMFRLNRKGVFLDYKADVTNLYAQSEATIIGKYNRDIVPPEFADLIEQKIEITLKDGGLHTFEYQLPIPNQGIQYYEARMTPSGPDEVIVIVRNITERKQAEAALSASEAKYRLLYETMAQGIVYQDGQGKILSTNSAAEKILGLTLDQMQGRTSIDPRWRSIHEDGSDFPGETHPAMVALREGRHVSNVVMGVFNPETNEYRWININAIPHFRDGESAPYQVYTTFDDITERKLAEAQLRTSEERFRSLFESSHAIMMIIDPNSGAIMDANPAAEKFYGYSHAQLTSMNISDINQLDPEKIAAERLKAVNAQQNYFVFPHRLASGEIRIVEVRSSRIELFEQTLLFSIISDITDRKQAELQKEAALEKLRESNETAQAILNAASESVFLMNLDGTVVAANETTAARLGKDLPGLLGVNMFSLLPPDVVETRRRYLDWVVREQKSVRFEDQRFGIWMENNIYPIFDANGQVQRVAIFGRDITDRKQADEALKQSEEKFRLLAETIGEVFWMFDNQQRKIAYISPAYEKIWGRTPKSLYEDSLQYIDAILPEDRHIMFAALEKQSRGEETEMEYRIVRLDGTICWINDRSFPIFDDTGAVIRTTGIATDITERKHNESLIYAQRDLARAVGRYQTILDGFPSFLQIIINVSGMDSGGIYLFDDGYKNLDIICHQGLGKDFVRMVNHFTVDSPQVKIILDGKPIYFSSDHPIVGNTMHQAEGLQCLAAIPILYQEQVVGCMNLASHTLAEVPEFARHVFETLAVEIGNFVIYLRNEETLRNSEEKYRTLSQELEQRVKERTAEVYAVHERLELATQAAELGTWDWSVQTNQLHWDTQMFLISRVDKDSFTGNIDFSTRRIHPEDAVIVTQKTQELMNGTSERGLLEYRILRGDGSIGYLKTHAVVQRDAQNQVERVIGMVQDVTHEKLAENALRDSYDRLSIANIELENALQVKDEFLASMSHELRTPLTGILGLSEALQLNTYGQLTEKQMRTLKNIEDSGKHLLSLINDILDLSKIESGKLEIQTASCSLADICQASLQLTKGMANQKRQIINYSAPAVPIILDVDMRRIKQVIVNLLSNAIKFTPETGELGLNIEADKLERQVRIIVWDKGIGIKPENLPKLFKPFTQIDSSLAREYSGTGLGLSLVKRLVELHDGTVTVESVFGEGSRFIVTLPWTTQASVPLSQDMPISQTETTTENASAQLILITDDNRLLLDMLADFLEAQKYRTAKVYSGSEFLEKVAEIRPDLILMDIQMPGMDGLEVIRNLRKHQEPFIASIPVIAVTALAMAGDRERCLAAGANEYVSKPVVLKELKQSIHTLLGKDVE